MAVLLIDDQCADYTTYKEEFLEHKIDFFPCPDATTGYRKAKELDEKRQLDAIIMDIIMFPGEEIKETDTGRKAGLVLAQRLRKEDINCPIIFHSVVSDKDIINECNRISGSTLYINKTDLADVVSKACSYIS